MPAVFAVEAVYGLAARADLRQESVDFTEGYLRLLYMRFLDIVCQEC
ncbi:MAG: hypothetical protein J7L98_04395 [Candidatus Verstraetearchaeota archaeon]|nr:hypothetical protein [Candidatus Verstraetearchaeota archaeon]